MADSGISSDEDDVPTSLTSSKKVGKTLSPFYKLKKVLAAKQAQLTGNKNDNGRGEDDSDTERRVQTQPNKGEKKALSEKEKAEMLQKFGKEAARNFIHSHTVFPNNESFTMRNEENSFSSLLFNTFFEGSKFREDTEFPVLLSSKKSLWYRCCNQVRGDLIFRTKDKYFGEFHKLFLDSNTLTDMIYCLQSVVGRKAS